MTNPYLEKNPYLHRAPKEGMKALPGPLEAAYLEWYARMIEGKGLNPNPDDPRHFYDYRAQFLAGPEHWPSSEPGAHGESRFKLRGHPNRFVEAVQGGRSVLEDTLKGKPATKAARRANERRFKKVMSKFPEENE